MCGSATAAAINLCVSSVLVVWLDSAGPRKSVTGVCVFNLPQSLLKLKTQAEATDIKLQS